MDATIDGVLGGFGHLTEIDIRDSQAFLRWEREPSHAPLARPWPRSRPSRRTALSNTSG